MMDVSKEDMKHRGLIFKGRYPPYNPMLIPRARELRKNMTLSERKLWTCYLHSFPYRVLAQRPIDNYIVDFYCPTLGLVIEIDGEQHYTEAGKSYDAERDGILSGYGLKILRVTNREVMEYLPGVCRRIREYLPSQE